MIVGDDVSHDLCDNNGLKREGN